MSNANSLQDLAQRIKQQEAELASLRAEHETRQAKLTKLTQQKMELQGKLQQIESEIAAVDDGSLSISAPASPSTLSAVAPTAKPPASQPTAGVKLPQLLVSIVEEANRPITVKEMTDQLIQRKFPTASKNLQGMVQTRVSDLVKQGLIRRAADQSGFIVGKAGTAMKSIGKNTSTGEQKKVATVVKQAKATKPSVPAKPVEAAKKQPLREAIAEVLGKASRPLSAQELADQVLANGYETASNDFKSVIWAGIGKMDSIERAPEGGYRLKKGKA